MEGPRSLEKEELHLAVELSDRIFSRGRNSMKDLYPLLFSEKNAENIKVFMEKRKVVSMVGLLPKEVTIYGHKALFGLIGSVCTDPKYRGKGLATTLLRQVEKDALKMGISVLYISGDRNLYRRFGAVDAGVFFTTILTGGKENSDVRKARLEDLPKLCSIYSQKAVRFIRTYEDFLKLFRAGYAVDHKATYYVFKDSYAVFVERNGNLEMVEYGGTEREVLEIVKHVLFEEKKEKCALHFPGFSGYTHFFDEKKRRNFLGTVKIISKDLLFEQLKGYFLERIPRKIFEDLREYLKSMDAPDVTRYLFGSTEVKIKYPSWCKSVLPVPIPDYGVDYV